jgi:hypothetical protein
MKNLLVFLLMLACSFNVLSAQAKAVHFKKLQEFLPTAEIKGFERKKPTGQTQSAMGMTTSEATVRYVEPAKENQDDMAEETMEPTKTIEVSISDISGIPFAAMTAMVYQQDFENETEDGYEKSTVIKTNYRGKETVSTGDYKRCEIEFMVANRFVVKLKAENTDDVKLLYTLIDGIDVAKLEKAQP